MASKKFTQFNTANNTAQPEISVGVKGSDNFKRANYLTATTNPTASNDGTQGYTVGSLWFNVTDSLLYICKSSATGAAVWLQVSDKSGEWTPTATPDNGASVSIENALFQYSGGSVVNFSIYFSFIQMDAGESSTSITISDLPIPTTFSSRFQAIGSCSIGADISEILSLVIESNTTANTFTLTVSTQSNGGQIQSIGIVGQYLVL